MKVSKKRTYQNPKGMSFKIVFKIWKIKVNFEIAC